MFNRAIALIIAFALPALALSAGASSITTVIGQKLKLAAVKVDVSQKLLPSAESLPSADEVIVQGDSVLAELTQHRTEMQKFKAQEAELNKKLSALNSELWAARAIPARQIKDIEETRTELKTLQGLMSHYENYWQLEPLSFKMSEHSCEDDRTGFCEGLSVTPVRQHIGVFSRGIINNHEELDLYVITNPDTMLNPVFEFRYKAIKGDGINYAEVHPYSGMAVFARSTCREELTYKTVWGVPVYLVDSHELICTLAGNLGEVRFQIQ